MDENLTPAVQAVRPEREILTCQQLPYFIGISGRIANAHGLSMHLVVIPSGAALSPTYIVDTRRRSMCWKVVSRHATVPV